MEAQAVKPGPPDAPSRPVGSATRTAPRRLLADRAARWLVTGGGLAIIGSILAILIFILVEVWPMIGGARVTPGAEVAVPGLDGAAIVSDEYRSHVAVLTPDGRIRAIRIADGTVVVERSLIDEERPFGLRAVGAPPGQQLLTATTTDGRVLAVPIDWEISFSGQDRVMTPVFHETISFEVVSSEPDPGTGAYAVRVDDDGAGTAVAQLSDGSIAVARRSVETNLFTEESEETWERFEGTSPLKLSALVMDQDQRLLYGGAAGGDLVWWTLEGGEPGEPHLVETGGAGVTTLGLMIGDRSLVVGREDGALEIWFIVRQEDESLVLERIREFPPHDSAIATISPSLRDKGFLALDDAGGMGLYYSTSRRTLWTGESPVQEAVSVFYTPKADGAAIAGRDRVAFLDIRNPHPEVSFTSLFGRVWYEGYPEPDHVWQSSSATDDFEPKLSLTPLLVGTLKGTVYSLILAIPLGVLGAMYTSQFMHPGFKRYVKPTVEIMAALPSVVLGFLAGLWLAPRVETMFPALMLMLVFLPLSVVAAGLLWRALPRAFRGRFRMGAETLPYMVVVALVMWACLEAGPVFERLAFGGYFPDWLLDVTGLRYDQRNAVVVGLAMGFAVIPIIFSIAEDAFSNVPRNLLAGSLALGANRWQTVTRVILPTASPGIFSAIMIGFGRAVGETMIVLMATGNTPVMDWNPFNGFRTLSANIAVEIPEAPHGGTLYRMLFLAALMLFVLTFVLNTLAELVRQRLRRRYSQL